MKTIPKSYNILFYFSDQQRADTCGCYGQRLPITPNIDALAAEGTTFEHAMSPQPVCGPCRAIFQTGRYATDLDCFRNNKMLPLGVKTVANYMENSGYENAYVGKWHLASEGNLEEVPFLDFQTKPVPQYLRGGYNGFWRASDVLEFTSDAYGGYIYDEHNVRREFEGYRCDCITDHALEFLDTFDQKRPFFLTVSHIEPHHQNNAHHYQGPKGEEGFYDGYDVPADLAASPEGDWKEEYPDYLGACHSIDTNLGRLVSKLKEKGLYENTIIIFSSDHGSHFKTRNRDGRLCGYDDYKRTCHDAAVHVPLVIGGGPFATGGRRIKEIVSTGSLPKTIVELGGTPIGDLMIGENLATLVVDGPGPNRDNAAFIQISESRLGRAIRTEGWTYSVVAPDINGGAQGTAMLYVDDFLYDNVNDPSQLENLVDVPEYAQVKAGLRQRLHDMILAAEHLDVQIVENNAADTQA